MPNTELTAGFPEFVWSVAVSTLSILMPQELTRQNRTPQKLDGGFDSFVWVNARTGCPGSIIHTDMQIFPAGTATRDLSRSRLSVSHAINLAQTLDIQMKHLSGLFLLITSHRKFFLQRGEAGAIKFVQDAKTVLRERPRLAAMSSPVCRCLRRAKTFPCIDSVSLLRQRTEPGTPVSQNFYATLLITFFHFLAVRTLTPKTADTIAAGYAPSA